MPTLRHNARAHVVLHPDGAGRHARVLEDRTHGNCKRTGSVTHGISDRGWPAQRARATRCQKPEALNGRAMHKGWGSRSVDSMHAWTSTRGSGRGKETPQSPPLGCVGWRKCARELSNRTSIQYARDSRRGGYAVERTIACREEKKQRALAALGPTHDNPESRALEATHPHTHDTRESLGRKDTRPESKKS